MVESLAVHNPNVLRVDSQFVTVRVTESIVLLTPKSHDFIGMALALARFNDSVANFGLDSNGIQYK